MIKSRKSRKNGVFSELYEDANDIIVNKIIDILRGVLHLDPINKTVIIKDKFYCESISNKLRILIGLVAIKAMHIEKWIETDEVTPKELGDLLNINYSTVRVILSKDLTRSGYARKSDRGKYKINISKIDSIHREIKEALERC